MGLDSGFKKYVEEAFPEAVVAEEDVPDDPAAALVDAMCVLHAWRPGGAPGAPPRVSDLARYLWRQCVAGTGETTVLVVAFDNQRDTPRVKDLEHARRRVCEEPKTPDQVGGCRWGAAAGGLPPPSPPAGGLTPALRRRRRVPPPYPRGKFHTSNVRASVSASAIVTAARAPRSASAASHVSPGSSSRARHARTCAN